MDWGAVIWMIFIILGAALLAGGIVTYSGSRRTGVRAFGVAAIAAAVGMWAIALVTIPVSLRNTDRRNPRCIVNNTSWVKKNKAVLALLLCRERSIIKYDGCYFRRQDLP